MNQPAVSILAAMTCAAALAAAQAPATDAYKLGTFELSGRTFLGLVIGDAIVADLGEANTAFERAAGGGARVAMPRDMKELIVRWEDGAFKQRVAALAKAAGAAQSRPSYVRDRKTVRARPPIMYPTTILNAAVNFAEHAAEMSRASTAAAVGAAAPAAAAKSESMPGMWQRKEGDTRHNPYYFLKPPSTVIADGEAIQLPPGREKIDWECEIAVVVGKKATRVPIERAADYIFGYTIENDVSDRGGRGDTRHGSDWLIGKGHDTFAPMGPFIVPKEFIKDPQKLAIKFTLSGKVMQDSNTDRMTHNVYEMLSFASHILTLHPGDVLSMGSPAGVGTARATPIYFKAGDTSVCTIEGIGTLSNPVVAAPDASPSAGR